jgi:thiol-disulfide isomerase/thioredoxin
MKNIILFTFLFSCLTLWNSCVFEDPFEGLAPGKWRVHLLLDGRKNQRIDKNKRDKFQLTPKTDIMYEEVSEGELPFIWEVIHTSPSDFHIDIINGEERINIPQEDIHYGKDKTNGHDTIWIDFPHYDAYFRGRYEENILQGDYILKTKENYVIPFTARYGQDYRFSQLRKEPALDVSGEWEVTFEVEEGGSPYKAIGEFKQDGNHLTGTFRTETGDYRFLEGTVQANKLYLSVFDGSHAFLFEAKIMENGTLFGSFRSGNHYKCLWEAKRNPDFKLANPYSLTYLKDGYSKFAFSFPNVDNQPVSLTDEQYKGKVKLVQIFGTWCPNCADETQFLSDYLKNNPNENLEVVGLAYERHKEFEKAAGAVKRMKKRFDVPYEILIAGTSSKKAAAETLPMLNAVISFPTLIFIDKNDKVRKIHTGFSGPATSKYDGFVKEFEALVQELLNE